MSTPKPPEGKKPTPVDDPLAKLIDNFSDEVEPIANTTDAGDTETPTTSEGDDKSTA